MPRKQTNVDGPPALPEPRAIPPGTPEWITIDLVRLTLKVWQKHYKEPLSTQDAVTILLNTGQLFGVLARE
jgi:hypothetical protein